MAGIEKQAIGEFYGQHASNYGSLVEDHCDQIWDEQIDQLGIKQGHNILDLGCGTGKVIQRISRKYENHELNICGVDLCQEMIAEAQKRIEWESKCILHRFSWHHKDALEYLQDCRQDSYDLVITAFLLAYIKTDKLFKLIAKVTKPGARLMILTTDYDRLKKFEVIFFWGFLLWHLADIKWWIPLFSQVQFTPPLKKIIKDLNKNGFSRVQVKREDAKIQFPDFADVIKWMDESGFATEYFDLAREGKREKMANAFMNWAEKKKINYFGQVGVRGKPFLLTWPINVIIAEK